MKPIRDILKKVTEQGTYDIPAVDKFLKSKKGEKFILLLGIKNITLLEREMQAPKLKTVDPINRLGLWMNRAKKLGLLPDKIPDDLRATEEIRYEDFRAKQAKAGLLKPIPRLGHYGIQKQLLTTIVRDEKGKPVQARDRKGRLLWTRDAKGDQYPVWLRKIVRQPKKDLHGADKINAYINHSMEKWERKHPHPINYGPLFNSQVVEESLAWQTKRNIFREYISKVMADRYGHDTTKKLPPFRLYALHKTKRADNTPVNYYQECAEPYHWGYPLVGIKTNEDVPTMVVKMRNMMAHIDNDITELSLFDKRGNLLHRQAA